MNLAGHKRYRIVTKIKQIKHLEDVEKEYYSLPGNGKARRIRAKDFPWDDLFVCGYGAGRVLGETREIYEEYRIKNAVGTLFRLHPKWQRYIIQLLCKQFPGVQFIVATHSPLSTSGITDLDVNKFQVLRFHKTGSEPARVVRVSSLRGLRADQILTSEAFDLQ